MEGSAGPTQHDQAKNKNELSIARQHNERLVDQSRARAPAPHNRASKKSSTRARISGALLDSYIALRNPAPPGTPWVNQLANCFILPTASGSSSSISIWKYVRIIW